MQSGINICQTSIILLRHRESCSNLKLQGPIYLFYILIVFQKNLWSLPLKSCQCFSFDSICCQVIPNTLCQWDKWMEVCITYPCWYCYFFGMTTSVCLWRFDGVWHWHMDHIVSDFIHGGSFVLVSPCRQDLEAMTFLLRFFQLQCVCWWFWVVVILLGIFFVSFSVRQCDLFGRNTRIHRHTPVKVTQASCSCY